MDLCKKSNPTRQKISVRKFSGPNLASKKILHPLKAAKMAREAVASLALQTSLDKWIPLRPGKANFLLHTRHTSICTEVSLECQGVAYGATGARETIPKFLRLPV